MRAPLLDQPQGGFGRKAGVGDDEDGLGPGRGYKLP